MKGTLFSTWQDIKLTPVLSNIIVVWWFGRESVDRDNSSNPFEFRRNFACTNCSWQSTLTLPGTQLWGISLSFPRGDISIHPLELSELLEDFLSISGKKNPLHLARRHNCWQSSPAPLRLVQIPRNDEHQMISELIGIFLCPQVLYKVQAALTKTL